MPKIGPFVFVFDAAAGENHPKRRILEAAKPIRFKKDRLHKNYRRFPVVRA